MRVQVVAEGLPVVRVIDNHGLGKILARGTSLLESADNSANARYVRTVIGASQAEVVIDGEVHTPPMSRSAAKRQAHSESHMYKQGSGWVVVTYDPQLKCSRTSYEAPYSIARQSLADWRKRRAEQLIIPDKDVC